MRRDEGYLEPGNGSVIANARLYWQAWLPDFPPRGVVILAHGYAEHSGRYDHVGVFCADRGLAVLAIDHWGHGKSEGRPGFVLRFSAYIDGMTALRAAADRDFPGIPKILAGHSMGGLIAATLLLTEQQYFAGCVLSGPAVMAAQVPSPAMQAISRLLSVVLPKLGVLALDAAWISRDPAVVRAYLADPLVYKGKLSARLAVEMFAAMTRVQAEAHSISLPAMLMHGDADSLAAPAGSQFLFDHVASHDRQLRLYPGLCHEIFNEPEQFAILEEMTDWITLHIDDE
jgi:alpha-beta hydrolase superfamily lysophospholipase